MITIKTKEILNFPTLIIISSGIAIHLSGYQMFQIKHGLLPVLKINFSSLIFITYSLTVLSVFFRRIYQPPLSIITFLVMSPMILTVAQFALRFVWIPLQTILYFGLIKMVTFFKNFPETHFFAELIENYGIDCVTNVVAACLLLQLAMMMGFFRRYRLYVERNESHSIDDCFCDCNRNIHFVEYKVEDNYIPTNNLQNMYAPVIEDSSMVNSDCDQSEVKTVRKTNRGNRRSLRLHSRGSSSLSSPND